MDRKDVTEMCVILIGAIAALVVTVAAITLAMYPLEKISCNADWPSMEHRYSLFGGCQVKTASGFIPAKNYRESTEAK